jgi:nitrile hydratase
MSGERAIHDVGGLELGPIPRDEHPRTLYEQRVDALLMLLISPSCGAFKVDAMRRVIEEYNAADYHGWSYYDRWMKAVALLLVEQGILAQDEIDARLAAISAEAAHA